jgi:hypothetical protein
METNNYIVNFIFKCEELQSISIILHMMHFTVSYEYKIISVTDILLLKSNEAAIKHDHGL